MTSIKKLTQFVGLGLAAMGLVACGGGGSTSGGDSLTTQSGTGLMSLAVTDDAIGDAKHVWIEFTHVELQPADGGERVVIPLVEPEPAPVEEADETASVDDQVDPLVEGSDADSVDESTQGVVRKIDLLALQGEESEFLFEDVAVPAGDYDWIRFYLKPDDGASSPPLTNFLTSSYIVFEDGTEAQLIIPGGLQAGLQLVSGFAVPADDSVSYTVDFDLRNMIEPDNQFEGYYRMRRALRLVDNSEVGVITGAIDVVSHPELDKVAATCTQDGARCPGLSVSVYNGAPVEEGAEPEQGSDQGGGGVTLMEATSVEEPLTTANVFYKHSEGEYEYQYTVGFLSEGSYDLKLVFEGLPDPLDQAKGVSVVAGETSEVNFSNIE